MRKNVLVKLEPGKSDGDVGHGVRLLVRRCVSAHGVLSPAKRPDEAPSRKGANTRSGTQGHRPGAVRRFRPFPIRRHRLSPAVSRGHSGCFTSPGFGSRVRFSGTSFRCPFDQVQGSENHVRPEFRSGAACAASVCSVRHPFRPILQSCSASAKPGSGSVGLPPSVISGLPPGSCLLFRLSAVRFVHGRYLEVVLFVCFSSVSVQLVFACPFRSVLLIFRSIRLSFPFRFVFALFPFVSDSFRLRLILSLFRVRLSVCALILYYISRILYTAWFVFQMYFLSENMSFFEIVQTIDINFGEVSPGQETDFTRPGPSGITTKKTAADTTPMRESVWTGTKRFMQPRRIRRRYIVCTKNSLNATTTEGQ